MSPEARIAEIAAIVRDEDAEPLDQLARIGALAGIAPLPLPLGPIVMGEDAIEGQRG